MYYWYLPIQYNHIHTIVRYDVLSVNNTYPTHKHKRIRFSYLQPHSLLSFCYFSNSRPPNRFCLCNFLNVTFFAEREKQCLIFLKGVNFNMGIFFFLHLSIWNEHWLKMDCRSALSASVSVIIFELKLLILAMWCGYAE